MIFSDPTFQHFMAGITGGIISTGSLYPLELIKTRMQVVGGENKVYRSFSKALVSVYRTEGMRGFFQGLSPALFAASGSWGGYFYFYEKSKDRKLQSKPSLETQDFLLSGFEAGIILVFLFNPFWVIKTRLALQAVEDHKHLKKYNGPFDAFKTIAREEGIRGLYKGVVPALFLTSHGAIQFAAYEELKVLAEKFRPAESKHLQPAHISLLLGGLSKIVASVATYPYQVIKSKLQQREPELEHKRYRGMIDCVVKIWKSQGFIGFFRGLMPNILKVVPSSALTFLVYEETMKILRSSMTPQP